MIQPFSGYSSQPAPDETPLPEIAGVPYDQGLA